MSDTWERLQNIFRDIFEDDGLVLREEMTAADVKNWDSLNHIDLIVAVEREFKVRFTTAEVTTLGNVGALVTLVDKKRAPKL